MRPYPAWDCALCLYLGGRHQPSAEKTGCRCYCHVQMYEAMRDENDRLRAISMTITDKELDES
jgi:hypothetical protein